MIKRARTFQPVIKMRCEYCRTRLAFLLDRRSCTVDGQPVYHCAVCHRRVSYSALVARETASDKQERLLEHATYRVSRLERVLVRIRNLAKAGKIEELVRRVNLALDEAEQ